MRQWFFYFLSPPLPSLWFQGRVVVNLKRFVYIYNPRVVGFGSKKKQQIQTRKSMWVGGTKPNPLFINNDIECNRFSPLIGFPSDILLYCWMRNRSTLFTVYISVYCELIVFHGKKCVYPTENRAWLISEFGKH